MFALTRLQLFIYYLYALLWSQQDTFIWSPALAWKLARIAAWYRWEARQER